MRLTLNTWPAALTALVLCAPLAAQDVVQPPEAPAPADVGPVESVRPAQPGAPVPDAPPPAPAPELNAAPDADPVPAPYVPPVNTVPVAPPMQYEGTGYRRTWLPGPPAPITGTQTTVLHDTLPSVNWGLTAQPGTYGAPGGDLYTGTRIGSPYYWSTPYGPGVGAVAGNYHGGDPFTFHFGPGYHRHSNYGHYRYPQYSYRAPWYYVGPPSYNRDTNYPW